MARRTRKLVLPTPCWPTIITLRLELQPLVSMGAIVFLSYCSAGRSISTEPRRGTEPDERTLMETEEEETVEPCIDLNGRESGE